MRPYPSELLDSAIYSLREVIIPKIDDEWATYVAKCLEKVLTNVQVRIDRELLHLAEDTAATRELLTSVLGQLSGSPELAPLVKALEQATALEVTPPASVAGIHDRVRSENQAARALTVAVVDTLYAVRTPSLSAAAEAEAESVHERVRKHLEHQLELDVQLMSSLFMAFGAPPGAPATTESSGAAT